MRELKPCPFCGGEARPYSNGKEVICLECECCGPFMDTEAEAIEAWNDRAERTCENVPQVDGAWFKCSECGFWMDWYVGDTNGDDSLNYCPNCGRKVVSE